MPQKRRSLVYALRDPRSGEYRYIGKSSSGLCRPRAHARLARLGHHGHRYNWIRSLFVAGVTYAIDVLEEVSREYLDSREAWWIAFYRPFGHLTNVSDGGDEGDCSAGGRACSKILTVEQRRRGGLASMGRWSSEQRREFSKRSRANITPEQRKAAGKASVAARAPEDRLAASSKGGKTTTSNKTQGQLRDQAKYFYAGLSVEECSAQARKNQLKIPPELRHRRAVKAGLAAVAARRKQAH